MPIDWTALLGMSISAPFSFRANLFMFLPNEADVIRELRAFAETLMK